ncbi:MAG: isoprenylcysteine carboxylmethyltransferase family protein [Anaerolineae bacterium]|nr:isoprenylcysteine carboxylmethyltransferase family protein [Anaerolineae bacterium]
MIENEVLYRLSYLLLIILVVVIRLNGHRQAGTLQEPRQQYEEGIVTRLMRPLPILLFFGSIAYIIDPRLVAWSTIALPDWLRITGIGLGIVVILAMAWVHSALNKQFSGKLEIRNDHQLVKVGPYRWVRHPMYTVVLALFLAVFLITANWFIGLGGLLMVLVVVITRTPREEAMLLEIFGDEYRTYMEETPRYLPRLH